MRRSWRAEQFWNRGTAFNLAIVSGRLIVGRSLSVVIDVIQADASRSTRIRRSSLSGVVQDWLDERELRGADVIRAQVALLVAAQLDADVPAYVLPKLSNELRQTIAEIEGLTTQVDGHQDVRRLLRDVLS